MVIPQLNHSLNIFNATETESVMCFLWQVKSLNDIERKKTSAQLPSKARKSPGSTRTPLGTYYEP